MKIRFDSDDDLPQGKILSIPVMVITGSVFQEGNKYYPQVHLHECVYKSVDRLQKVSIVLLVTWQAFIFVGIKTKTYQTYK